MPKRAIAVNGGFSVGERQEASQLNEGHASRAVSYAKAMLALRETRGKALQN